MAWRNLEGVAAEILRSSPRLYTNVGVSVETKAQTLTKKAATHPNTWVYYNGEFARYHDVKLGLMTHALHYGTAVF